MKSAKLLILPFLYHIKRNFAFIVNQVNKNKVYRKQFTKTYARHFKCIKNNHKCSGRSIPTLASVYQRFRSQIQKSYLKYKFLHKYFSRILLVDSELTALKIDFFKGISNNFVGGFQNSNLSKNWMILIIDLNTSSTKTNNFKSSLTKILKCFSSNIFCFL